MAFSEVFLQELADRNDIVDVVSGYVRLNKKSGSNLFGLCPFHSEKTPSFSVNSDKQIYHCFGCGKGGGVINFIMEIENLSFPEAVEFLAKRAGMPMPEESRDDPAARRREQLLALNKDAARFFYDQFRSPAGRPAQDYAARRELTPATVKKFGLGYAPESWNSLTDAMKAKGYSEGLLLQAGLVRKGKNGGVYDTFRNRLMFPVFNVRGNVIGFSGRILGDGEPKYMNSPETPVFSKSHNLFAMNFAKKSKAGSVILCEGNVDVVSMHQAGFDNAVASLGTSLTPEQARLISRYVNEVIIAYDNDGAGQKATARAIGILEKLDVKTRVLTLNGAKDPDEFIKKFGPDAFRNLLDKSEDQVDYTLRNIRDRYDLTNAEGKLSFLQEAETFVAGFSGRAERELYAMRLADLVGVSADAVKQDVESVRKRLAGKNKRQAEKQELNLTGKSPVRSIRYDNTRSAMAEEGVIRLMYLDPQLFDRITPPAPSEFTVPELGHIYETLWDFSKTGQPSFATLSGVLSNDEISLLTTILQKPEVLSNGQQALSDYIHIIRQERQDAQPEEDLRNLAASLRNRKGYLDMEST